MKKLLNEWREYLAEQTFEEADALRKKIFAANGDIKLSNNQLGQLTRYVDLQQAEDPLGAALIAAAIKVYYRAKEDNWSNRAIVKKYAKLEKHLKGLAPQAGRSPTVRAVDAFLGAKDPVIEKGLYRSPNSPVFAKAIIGTSTWFKSLTGINILDPTMVPKPPKWASKDPIKYAAWQTAADIFVKTPFDALLWLWPAAGAVGKSHTLNLARSAAGPSAKKVATNINKTGAAIAKGDVADARGAANAASAEAVGARNAIKNIPPKQGGAAVSLDAWGDIIHNEKQFIEWYKKSFGHRYVDAPKGELLRDAKEIRATAVETAMEQVYAIEKSMPLKRWMKTNEEFYDLAKKYNTRISGYDVDAAQVNILTDTPIFREKLKSAMEKGIPVDVPLDLVSPGIRLGPGRMTRAGSKKFGRGGLFDVLTHEAGHIEFMRNYPVVGETFLKEWSATLDIAIEKITERIARRTRAQGGRQGFWKKSLRQDADIAAEHADVWVHPVVPRKVTLMVRGYKQDQWSRSFRNPVKGQGYHSTEATPLAWRQAGRIVPTRKKSYNGPWLETQKSYRRRVRKSLEKHDIDIRVVSDSFNLYTMKGYKRIIERGMRDLNWFMTSGKYELRSFSDALHSTKKKYFGASQGDLYYLDPQEAFAELFSKASVHYRRQKKEPLRRWLKWYDPFQSKAFPETAKVIDDVVKAEILPHIKENIYRLNTKSKNYL